MAGPDGRISLGPIEQIETGPLSVGYAEVGPAEGPAVLLLHGWPYDIHSFVVVAPLLAKTGHRVIIPYLRGFGSTRFLSDRTVRNAQQSAVALDVIALMDALGIKTATLAGFDWGRALRRYRRGALAGALPWPGLGKRLSDRQPGSGQGAAAAGRRAAVVVSVLLRHGTRPDRVRDLSAGLRQADLAAGVSAVALRRRHLRPLRGGFRQPRSRRDRGSQLSLAARARGGRSQVRRPGSAPCRGAADHRPDDHAGRRRQRRPRTSTPARMPRNSPADTPIGPSRAGVGHNLPQEAPVAFAQAVLDVGAS